MTGKSNKDGVVDTIQEAMGSFGPWHLVIAISLSLVKFPVAWHQLSIAFLAPNANFSCASPASIDANATSMQCKVDVGNGTMEKCTKFEYDRSIFEETIITQWNLVCDRNQLANVAQSVIMFGILVGNMLFGMVSDRIGRKTPLMVAILLQTVAGLASAFSPWYELFLLLKFIAAVATGGTMIISFVILMEIVGTEWRSTLSVLFHVPFLLGYLMNPLISYLTRTWYGFQIAVSVPPILLLSYYWIVPESPRWLLAVGRVSEAEIILQKAADRNKIPLGNVVAAIESHENVMSSKKDEPTDEYNVLHLFKTPNMRMKTLCICFNWFVCGICFFGLAQYVASLGGNIFVNVAISATLELPGTVLVFYLISRVSRLKIIMAGNLLTGVSLLLIPAIPHDLAKVILASIGMVGMALSFPTVYLYSSEVFPTVVRNAGIGLGSTCARVSSMIAPYVVYLSTVQSWLPPVLFGIVSVIGAVLCLMLPETMNCELPETIDDGENFGNGIKFLSRKKSASNDVTPVLVFASSLLIFSLASAIQPSNYVDLIAEVHRTFVRSSIFLVHNKFEGMSEMQEFWRTVRMLSAIGIRAICLSFDSLDDRDALRKTHIRPLFVVVLQSDAQISEFSGFTENFKMSDPVWLLIFDDGADPQTLMEARRHENIFHLTFNTEMLVFENNSRNIQEWYAISNETRTADFASWDPHSGLVLQSNKTLYDRRRNLENSTIFVAVADDLSAHHFHNRTINNMFLDVLFELRAVLNFSIEILRPPKPGASQLPEFRASRWVGIMKMLEAGDANITSMELLMTAERAKSLDFTHSMVFTSSRLYIRLPDGVTSWSGYLKIFTPPIWTAIGVSIVSTTVFSTFSTTANRKRVTYNSFVEQLLLVSGIYCQQGLAKFPKSTSLRIAYHSAFLAALVLSAAYSAFLMSYVAVTTSALPFTTMDGFAADGRYQLVVFRNSADYDQFSQSIEPTQKKMFSLMKPLAELPVTLADALQQICAEKAAFFIQDIQIRMSSIYAPCTVVAASANLIANFGFTMTKDNTLRGVINHYIQQFRYDGILNRYKKLYVTTGDAQPTTFYQVGYRAVAPLLAILGAGIAFSGFLLIIERLSAPGNVPARGEHRKRMSFPPNRSDRHRSALRRRLRKKRLQPKSTFHYL